MNWSAFFFLRRCFKDQYSHFLDDKRNKALSHSRPCITAILPQLKPKQVNWLDMHSGKIKAGIKSKVCSNVFQYSTRIWLDMQTTQMVELLMKWSWYLQIVIITDVLVTLDIWFMMHYCAAPTEIGLITSGLSLWR